jgi:hypothetical protein
MTCGAGLRRQAGSTERRTRPHFIHGLHPAAHWSTAVAVRPFPPRQVSLDLPTSPLRAKRKMSETWRGPSSRGPKFAAFSRIVRCVAAASFHKSNQSQPLRPCDADRDGSGKALLAGGCASFERFVAKAAMRRLFQLSRWSPALPMLHPGRRCSHGMTQRLLPVARQPRRFRGIGAKSGCPVDAWRESPAQHEVNR